MGIHNTLWHLGRVAHSSILGETEQKELKRAEYLLGILKNLAEYHEHIQKDPELWRLHQNEFRKDCRMLCDEAVK